MDIALVKDNSLKIKGGRGGTSIVTDPVSKVEGQVVILTDHNPSYDVEKVEGKKLVIYGEGEYEVGGLSIVAKLLRDQMVFTISSQNDRGDASKILLMPSNIVQKMQEEDEFDSVIIKVNEKINEDMLSVLNAKCFVLYGDLTRALLNTEKKETVNRVSLKKGSEIQGKIFLLS